MVNNSKKSQKLVYKILKSIGGDRRVGNMGIINKEGIILNGESAIMGEMVRILPTASMRGDKYQYQQGRKHRGQGRCGRHHYGGRN